MDSSSPRRSVLDSLSGEWKINLENRIPPKELYQARIASSKPSLGFFVLLLCAAVIATLGLIANSTAVVIGAMIVAPLMDPILSLAFGLSISNNQLAKRSMLTVVIGVISVIATAALLSSLLGVSEVNREMTSRTAPNLIDLGVAVAAAVAGSSLKPSRSESICDPGQFSPRSPKHRQIRRLESPPLPAFAP